jgi:hypothetical protein
VEWKEGGKEGGGEREAYSVTVTVTTAEHEDSTGAAYMADATAKNAAAMMENCILAVICLFVWIEKIKWVSSVKRRKLRW